MKSKPSITATLYHCAFVGIGLWESTAIAEPIYIDVSSGTPFVWSPSPNYWTSIPILGGLESSVKEIASGAWEINIGITGSYRGTSNGIRGLELTDPITGAIVDSFGVDGFGYNDLMSWTTIHSELFTTNSSGNLAGRTSRISNAVVPSEVLVLGSPQLAMYGVNTEWNTWEIYLTGMAGLAQDPSVPEPATLLLVGIGVTGLIRARRKRNRVNYGTCLSG